MNNPAIRNSRLNKELTDLDRDPPPGISCYPKEDNLTDLEAYIKGPPDSPYEQGLFKLDIQIPIGYPFEPPQIRFVTSIYHPNIDDAGRICADILKKGEKGSWKPALNLSTTLILLSQLLAHPNPDDPLDADIAKEYQLDYPTFQQKAIEYTKKYAMEEALSDGIEETEGKQVESIKVSITKSQCDKEEDEKDEENTESRKPKLSLSLTKKTSATSSQSSPSSSFDTKPKPALGKLSTSKKEKNVLEVIKNSQAVPDLTIVKKVNHKKDVVENHTEELDIASNKSLVDKAKDFVVEMKEDLVKNEKENVIMDEKKDLIVIIKEDNEDFLVNNKEDVIIDNNEADTKDTEMQLQNVKIHPRKLTKKWSEKQSMIETESVTANHSSSQSKSDTLNISQTELVSSNEAVKPSTVNTLKDTQTYAKRKFVVLDEKPDVIELSDDDNEDGDLIHTLQLSRKLKRNRISLSKQKR